MKAQEHNGGKRSRFIFFPRSIQQRLPVFIIILLTIVVLLFTTAAYIGVRSTSMGLGRERLTSLSLQIATLFGQSAKNMTTKSMKFANDDSVAQLLGNETNASAAKARAVLRKMQQDTLVSAVDLVDLNGVIVLHVGNDSLIKRFPVDSLLRQASMSTGRFALGRMRRVGDSIYFPIVISATYKTQPVGYLVNWRRLVSDTKSVKAFSELLGTRALFYLGNADGSVWMDMIRPVQAPPAERMTPNRPATYKKDNGDRVMSVIQPIPDSPWMVQTEFSEDLVVEGAHRFVYWLTAMGLLLIAGGSLLGWSLSRYITKPLKSLTEASTAIAGGDYSLSVPDHHQDEIGQLARSFKKMVSQLQQQQQELESKVLQRTAELQDANRELEAFSYSVSHDLRAPLRAVSGYANMLQEDHGEKLDEEGKRILGQILSGARSMGMLIDDLIAFSRIGRKELVHQPVNMKELVETSLATLIRDTSIPYTIQTDDLPMCRGDRGLLFQVWMNLLGNAVKYTSKTEHPAIHIGCSGNPDNPEYFVQDNGVGFDMKYAHKLFGVFQRLHSAEEFEGTGIGLALVQRIVNKHGGNIRAEGRPGQGAIFSFNIPG